jgi:hypothetical protein
MTLVVKALAMIWILRPAPRRGIVFFAKVRLHATTGFIKLHLPSYFLSGVNVGMTKLSESVFSYINGSNIPIPGHLLSPKHDIATRYTITIARFFSIYEAIA